MRFELTLLCILVAGCGDSPSTDNSTYVGGPVDGDNGLNSIMDLIRFTGDYTVCTSGSGAIIKVGLDTNGDEILDDNEISKETYICDGIEGPQGNPGQDGEDGEDGQDGQNGTMEVTSFDFNNNSSCQEVSPNQLWANKATSTSSLVRFYTDYAECVTRAGTNSNSGRINELAEGTDEVFVFNDTTIVILEGVNGSVVPLRVKVLSL